MRIRKYFLRFRLYLFEIVDGPNLLQGNYIVLSVGALLRDSGYARVSISGNIWYAPDRNEKGSKIRLETVSVTTYASMSK